ncbi:6-pyruvoyl tetrahydropterin synthase family protein [Thermostilla marina]
MRIEESMYHVSREIEFCYGHRLLNYPGKCRHLHGHNGRLIVSFAGGGLDDLGMVLDFGTIKQIVGKWIDENLDHKMILCRDDPLIPHLEQLQEEFFVIDANPTAENIAKLVYDYAKQQGLPVVGVKLWETPRCSATYGEYPSSSAEE